MLAKSSRLVAVVVGMLLAVGLVPTVAAAADTVKSDHQRVVEFWTKDKVAKAQPRDFVLDPADGTFKPVAAKPAGGGKRTVSGASWNGGGTVLQTTGKVLFALGTDYYVCSASVAKDSVSGRSIILTAAHCVFDHQTRFASMWMFVPDYDTKPVNLDTSGGFCAETRYGCWTATALVVHRGFADAGSFNAQATWYDFAFAVVEGGGLPGDAQLDVTVGTQNIAFTAPALNSDTYLFGYPAASPFTGTDLVYSRGPLGQDPYNLNLTYRVSSTMTGGSSGGPWFAGFNAGAGTGTLFSVNSYGYTGIKAMHGPKFNAATQSLFDAAATVTTHTIVR